MIPCVRLGAEYKESYLLPKAMENDAYSPYLITDAIAYRSISSFLFLLSFKKFLVLHVVLLLVVLET